MGRPIHTHLLLTKILLLNHNLWSVEVSFHWRLPIVSLTFTEAYLYPSFQWNTQLDGMGILNSTYWNKRAKGEEVNIQRIYEIL